MAHNQYTPKEQTKYAFLMNQLATINTEECVVWEFNRTAPNGYGRLKYERKEYTVHRLALEYKLGRSLGLDMLALHSCDNPPCYNPAHLYEGTSQDNVDDMIKRKRDRLFGERNPNSVLTWDDVAVIRLLRSIGVTQKALSERFNTSRANISLIDLGQTWTRP